MTVDFRPIDLTEPHFADFYDELPLWSAPFGLRILERVPLTRGQTLLDIGCGSGFLSVELAQRCGRHSKVVAVDPWSAAMERLRRKLAYLNIANVELHETMADRLGLSDESVDTIVSNLGINNFEAPEAVLKECRRVLKPGGRLLLTTNLSGQMRQFYAVYRAVLDKFHLPEARAALDREEAGRGTRESVERRLAEAGFKITYFGRDTIAARYADGTAFLGHWFTRLAFLPAWAALVEESDRTSIFAEIEDRLNEHAAKHGELSFDIPVAVVDAQR